MPKRVFGWRRHVIMWRGEKLEKRMCAKTWVGRQHAPVTPHLHDRTKPKGSICSFVKWADTGFLAMHSRFRFSLLVSYCVISCTSRGVELGPSTTWDHFDSLIPVWVDFLLIGLPSHTIIADWQPALRAHSHMPLQVHVLSPTYLYHTRSCALWEQRYLVRSLVYGISRRLYPRMV